MKLNEAISLRLQEIMGSKQVNQYQLFIKSGVSQSTINDIRLMYNKSVKLNTLFDLLSAMNVELVDFFDSPLLKIENITD